MSRSTLFMMLTVTSMLTGCSCSPSRSAAAPLPADSSYASSAASPAPGISSSSASSAPAGQTSDDTDAGQEETVEYHGISKKRSEVSEDTIRWLEWYHTLPEEQQNALNFVPSEFSHSGADYSVAAMETDSEIPAYQASLTEDELMETAELARYYFTELNPVFDGVEQLLPVEDSCDLYHNIGLENEYAPGNIIIYRVETGKDKKEGNPMRFISIARRSKSDEWKVINSGF